MRLKQGCSGIWIAATAAAIDQISKSAIRRIYENRPSLWLTGSGRLWEWQGLFAIRATSNTGVAFSMLSSSGIALILFTALIIAALTGWLIAKPNALPKTARAGMWMIIGGGLGNLYDRIVYGAVMDFIEPLFVRFAVFNVADIAIVCGAILTAVSIYIDESRKDTAHEREI